MSFGLWKESKIITDYIRADVSRCSPICFWLTQIFTVRLQSIEVSEIAINKGKIAIK